MDSSWVKNRNLKQSPMVSSCSLLIVILSVSNLATAAAAAKCSSELSHSLFNTNNASPPDQDLFRKIDRLILIHAFKALLRPHTGTVYDVPLPMGLESGGIFVQAVRLKTGSLQHRGFIFNEFIIPPKLSFTISSQARGGIAKLVPEYVVLVYRFFSLRYSPYCPRNGMSIIGPVVGIKAYSGMEMEVSSSSSPVEAEAVALEDPVTARIPMFPLSDSNKVNPALCALFDGNGNTTVTPMTYVNVCSMYQLGDVTLVNFSLNPGNDTDAGGDARGDAAGSPPSSSPIHPPSSSPISTTTTTARRGGDSSSEKKRLKLGLLSGIGVVTISVVVAFAVLLGLRIHRVSAISRMEISGEVLGATLISHNSRPPCASTMRTAPALERDYVFR